MSIQTSECDNISDEKIINFIIQAGEASSWSLVYSKFVENKIPPVPSREVASSLTSIDRGK